MRRSCTRIFDGHEKGSTGEFGCEAPIPVQYLATFRYPDQTPAFVRADLRGCDTVRNNLDPVYFSPSGKMVRRLAAIAGASVK